jgi:hypothetical protein
MDSLREKSSRMWGALPLAGGDMLSPFSDAGVKGLKCDLQGMRQAE